MSASSNASRACREATHIRKQSFAFCCDYRRRLVRVVELDDLGSRSELDAEHPRLDAEDAEVLRPMALHEGRAIDCGKVAQVLALEVVALVVLEEPPPSARALPPQVGEEAPSAEEADAVRAEREKVAMRRFAAPALHYRDAVALASACDGLCANTVSLSEYQERGRTHRRKTREPGPDNHHPQALVVLPLSKRSRTRPPPRRQADLSPTP